MPLAASSSQLLVREGHAGLACVNQAKKGALNLLRGSTAEGERQRENQSLLARTLGKKLWKLQLQVFPAELPRRALAGELAPERPF